MRIKDRADDFIQFILLFLGDFNPELPIIVRDPSEYRELGRLKKSVDK